MRISPRAAPGAPPSPFGAAVRPIVSHWPFHGEDEIAAVADVLRSGRVNAMMHGDRCRAFQDSFAGYIGAAHAIAVANGTLALELGLRALGIGPGDEVIVTPRSYFASASCIVAVGAKPVFADVDPISQNIDVDAIANVLSSRTRAVICVHLAGWPCDMHPIMALCRRHGLKVIEDCAQALGASYHGRKAGSFGDAAAFSFCTDKIMSTGGEGGMLVIEDDRAWERAWSYKDHGKDRGRLASRDGLPGCFRWLHDGFGSNFRLTEMQAAIGLCQLGKLPDWLAARRRNAALLDAGLSAVPGLRTARPPDRIEHSYYKYYCFLRRGRHDDGAERDRLLGELQRLGVPAGSGACPEIHRERAFAGYGPPSTMDTPVARWLGATSIMLPVDPSLAADEMERMAATLGDCLAL
jgi:dTDP-4-amino-4,6-dideoxygalactose transaminase